MDSTEESVTEGPPEDPEISWGDLKENPENAVSPEDQVSMAVLVSPEEMDILD